MTEKKSPKSELRDCCPRCGSENIEYSSGKFSKRNGCLGMWFFGLIGLLMGLLNTNYCEAVCKDCSFRWGVDKIGRKRSFSMGCMATLILILLVIKIIFCGCIAIENPGKLEGSWIRINSPSRAPATLIVTNDGNFYGFGGVNRYRGKLALPFDNGRFSLQSPPATTRMFSPELEHESKYIALLQKADSWQVNKEGNLELLEKGKVLITFRRQTEKTGI